MTELIARQHIVIVIPVHNRCALTERCLHALVDQTATGFEVVVVDDGSTDGTGEMVSRFNDVHLLSGDGSLWWSGATNKGVQYALELGATHVLLLNDDTIPDVRMVEALADASRQNPGALIGAVAAAPDGRLIYGGERVDWCRARFVSLLDSLSAECRNGVHEVTHLPGRGMLVPASVFGSIGLFAADRFPQAIADYDFCHRAVRAGAKCLVSYEARLTALPNETANVKLRTNPSIRKYWEHLFGVRGAGNLPRFVEYAVRNCPRSCLLQFIVLGIVRRVGGYGRDWLRGTRPARRG